MGSAQASARIYDFHVSIIQLSHGCACALYFLQMAFTGYAGLGECPAGGLHNHAGSGNHCLPMGGSVPPGSQGNWRWCNECQALSFGGGKSMGKCSEGGMRILIHAVIHASVERV